MKFCGGFTSDVGVGGCSVQFTSGKYTVPTCIALNSQCIFKISMIEQANKPAVSLL